MFAKNANKKFRCNDCGTEKLISSEKPSATLYQIPNCCGKNMFVAS